MPKVTAERWYRWESWLSRMRPEFCISEMVTLM